MHLFYRTDGSSNDTLADSTAEVPDSYYQDPGNTFVNKFGTMCMRILIEASGDTTGLSHR